MYLEEEIKNIGKLNSLYKLILHESCNKETTSFNIIIMALGHYFKGKLER